MLPEPVCKICSEGWMLASKTLLGMMNTRCFTNNYNKKYLKI